MHHSLYLISVHPDHRASAVLAVRASLRALGAATLAITEEGARGQGATFRAANEIVQRVLDGTPTLIGRHADRSVMDAIYTTNFEGSTGMVAAIDPTPEQVIAGEVPAPEDPEPQAPQRDPTSEAYETAMVLLCAMNGNPFGAWSVAGSLARTTRSDGFKIVQDAIIKVFPADTQTAAIMAETDSE